MSDDDRSGPGGGPDRRGPVPLAVIPLHSTNLLTVLDPEGVILYESPSIEHLYGFGQADLLGDPVFEYFHPDDRERVTEAFRVVVESDSFTAEAVEYRHEQADGSYRWVESVASANPTPAGNYVVNTRDVSKRKAREDALERANRRLDEFTSVVSHDLRNPLNVARGHLRLAREEIDSEHLDHAANAVERSLTLIDDLRALALEGDHLGGVEPVPLADVVEACSRTVELSDSVVVSETDRTVRADPSRLKQLLENVLRNAVEHGGDGVTVTVGDLADGFYVADDGPGIPEPERGDVFDVGYTTAERGTGLGLHIVDQIADAHGWEVDVVASDAGGTRIEITGVDLGVRG